MSRLSQGHCDSLLKPVTREEIKATLFHINNNKAAGPDGYSSGFYKGAWIVISDDFTNAVLSFFHTSELLSEINSTAITLIPKISCPARVEDYRPISLCNTIYKVISKLLANRLSSILNSLINPNQTAFIPSRRIGDNVLLAREILKGYNKASSKPSCTLKIDLKKAFDSLSWDFLFVVLTIRGFPPLFINWIKSCVTSVKSSISINGELHGYFANKTGLRQGDHLSPCLFVLIMDCLSWALEYHILNSNQSFKFHHLCSKTRLASLLFADDILLFCKADVTSLSVLFDGLNSFCSYSGLSINTLKSKFFLSKSALHLQNNFAAVLGFQMGSLPITYLGLPLIATKLSVLDCKPLIQHLESRMSIWSAKSLSYAGRLTIIKFVLCSLFSFWSSFFVLPKSIIKLLEQKIRSFMWFKSNGKGVALVNWNTCCKSKPKGGLGIISPESHNKAMNSKLIWFIIKDSLGNSLQSTSVWLSWIKANRLHNKDIWTILPSQSAPWYWNRLIKLRESILPAVSYIIGPDTQTVSWNLNPNGEFSVKSALMLFTAASLDVAWYGLFTFSLAQPRHLFILWLACNKGLLTRDTAWLPGNKSCLLCGDNTVESLSHLFFDCEFTTSVVKDINKITSWYWPSMEWNAAIDLMGSLWKRKQHKNVVSKSILAATIYFVWEERNRRYFKSISKNPTLIATKICTSIRDRFQVVKDIDLEWHIAW